MNEQEALAQLIDEIDAATSADVDVRTEGGEADIQPPEIILDWDASRIPDETGHTNLGGFVYDDSGNKTGYEFHRYFLMDVDVVARSYDEIDAHSLLRTVADTFSPYEYQSDWFHQDTAQWRTGDISPRSNPVVEPDWYEVGLPVRFKYIQRVTQTGDTLTVVSVDVAEESDTIEDGETSTETK